MGLDISAYKNATKVSDPAEVKYVMEHPDAPSEGAYEKGYGLPYKNPAPPFASRFGSLEEVPYEAEKGIHFRAGSYSGYGAWRKQLAELVGVQDIRSFWARVTAMEEKGEQPKDMPFWQLLHFSDCEGALGPVVCLALAEDFAKWESRARDYARELHTAAYPGEGEIDFEDMESMNYMVSEGTYFWAKYQEWKTAFEQGSSGWVAFH